MTKEITVQNMTKHTAREMILAMYENKELLNNLKDQEIINYLCNQDPPESWVKVHPTANGAKYLPIDKVEWLLRSLFKRIRIEVIDNKTAFNGVVVTVRVWYLNPVTGEMDYHDGIGAEQLQTKHKSSPSDLSNITHGALSRAFPIAKTNAIKDACDHFGRLFGADLNRKDIVPHREDIGLINKALENPLQSITDKIEG